MVEHERAIGATQGHYLAHRYHLATGAAHIEPFEILRRLAEFGFRLHDDAEGTPVQVEVVDIETAKVRLQGVKGIRNGHPEDLATLAIQIEPQLWLIDGKGGRDPSNLRTLPRRLQDQVGRLR